MQEEAGGGRRRREEAGGCRSGGGRREVGGGGRRREEAGGGGRRREEAGGGMGGAPPRCGLRWSGARSGTAAGCRANGGGGRAEGARRAELSIPDQAAVDFVRRWCLADPIV